MPSPIMKNTSTDMPKPTGNQKNLLEPNAKDNPDSLTPENPFKQAVGKNGKPPAPFGKMGRET